MTQILVDEQTLIALIGGVYILPFFLFSATAGQIADKYDKSVLIKIIKSVEIFIMLIGSIGFYFKSLTLLMATLFLLGIHSTFFGPIKYSILPNLLAKDELIGGNALIEAGTFVAILAGQILGSCLILGNNGVLAITIALFVIAVAGLVTSFFIPAITPANPNLPISVNIAKETLRIIHLTREKSVIFLGIIGISWFWFVGATLLTQLPTFTKEYLHGRAAIFTLFLTLFSFGIGTGSLLCNKLLQGKITAKYVPFAIGAMSIFLIDIHLAAPKAIVSSLPLVTLGQFLGSLHNFQILTDIFLMSACAGFFVVPLYALIQAESDDLVRSRIIAATNIISALFMVGSALFIMFFTALSFSIPQVFIVLAVGNLFMALYMRKLKALS